MMTTQITHFSAFSGIGGACSALKEAGIAHKTIGISEIDHLATTIRDAIIGDSATNIGDINTANWDKMETPYLFSGGFPCQPFSVMGLMKGMKDPRATAMFSMRKMILDLKPQYVLLENVGGILTARCLPQLMKFLQSFGHEYSYSIHKSNPNDLGFLQSRTRVFITLSRLDQTPWVIGKLPTKKAETWADLVDSKLDNSFFNVKAKPRITNSKFIVSPSSTKWACITKGAILSQCGRTSWIPHRSAYRSPTTSELFKLFGYSNFPSLPLKDGISRSSISRGFGNSWHVGHAALVLQSLPLPTQPTQLKLWSKS